MGTITFPYTLTAGQPEDVNKLNSNLSAITAQVNGAIDATNLATNAVTTAKITDANVTTAKLADANVTTAKLDATLTTQLGLTSAGRGKSIIATAQNTNSTSYTTLTTPDQVAGIVLPADGLIHIYFRALVKVNGGTGTVAIFIGANQLKGAVNAGGAPAVQETSTTSGFDAYVQTSGQGLTSNASTVASSQTLVTTGQSINSGSSSASPVCVVEAAAGTYTISVQFKNSLGGANQTQVNSRALWVKAETFA